MLCIQFFSTPRPLTATFQSFQPATSHATVIPVQWDWSNRTVHLAVGELAAFDWLAPAAPASGRWRAELGSHWHDQLRQQAAAQDPAWQFEVACSGLLQRHGWSFHLRGRIDQFKPPPQNLPEPVPPENAQTPEPVPALLREVKTIQQPLPADQTVLRQTYPAYFHQADLYRCLLQQTASSPHTPEPSAELLFLEIQTGLSQTVPLNPDDRHRLHNHLDAVIQILEERRRHFHQLRAFTVPPPFPQWRPGQQAARSDLQQALQSPGPVALEAPTGFGKTGLALEQALHALCSGQVERILLLTGKTTGQSPLLQQLQAFTASGKGPTVLPLRSRRDLTLPDEETTAPPSVSEMRSRWQQSGFSAAALLADHIPLLPELRSLGAQLAIPPYFINRLLMPYADVWIADYNYLFDPSVASVFENIPAFRPERSFLVVDEAHNLPERAAASRSHTLAASRLDAVLTELRFLRFPGRLESLCDQFLSRLRGLQATDQLDPPVEMDFLESLRELDAAFRQSAFATDEWSPLTRDWFYRIPALLADFDHPDLPFLVHAPARGILQFTCLDAAPAIRPVIQSFARCLLMSATLHPFPAFADRIGLPANGPNPPRFLEARSPYLPDCFSVFVDARVDTRYRKRKASAPTIIDTLAGSITPGNGCAAVFFPSYAYANQILEGIRQRHPHVRVALQPRDLPLEEQHAFIETALLLDDLLFLVLGSRFSEGIDALGGRIHTAFVIGPALPEFNAVQQARMDQLTGPRDERFHAVYRIPGIRKITQALGRMVRSPQHRARVLLVGQRFAEPAYLHILPPYLQPHHILTADKDLLDHGFAPSP